MVESEDELHSLLKVKQESKKSSSSFKLNIQKTEIMACSPITSWQIEEENVETVTYFIFLGFKITADSDCSLEIKKKKKKRKEKKLAPWKESYNTPRQCIKKQRHYFANKGPYRQSYGSPRSHVQMWELDHREGSALKNWFFRVVLEKIFKSLFGLPGNQISQP